METKVSSNHNHHPFISWLDLQEMILNSPENERMTTALPGSRCFTSLKNIRCWLKQGNLERKNLLWTANRVAKQLYFTLVDVWKSAPERQWSEPERHRFFLRLPTQSCDVTPWRHEWSHMRKWKIKQIHAPTRGSNTSLVVCWTNKHSK